MLERIDQEKREYDILSDHACHAGGSRGRAKHENECDWRTCFQRDRDRIIHSKAFRRLMHKTQVFLSPEGDHYRTRLTHTLEVSQIARTIARALALNEDLTEAIALGHDLGHTPFGHNGEVVLSKLYKDGFRHNEQSLRVVDVIEMHKGEHGMNLTAEVRDGILNHTGPDRPMTLEGQVVKISDRIAYINHDIDDALRSGVIKKGDLPSAEIEYLGVDHRSRIDKLVSDMIMESDDRDEIRQSKEAAFHMTNLRTFMFENVYLSESVKRASDMQRVENVITFLFGYYRDHFDEIAAELYDMKDISPKDELVKDHIAGMTDRYALSKYEELTSAK